MTTRGAPSGTLWEPETKALLAPLVDPGARCLEVGGGGGATVEWLAERVGASGSVVTTDLDTRFLAPLASGVVEVLEHDACSRPSSSRSSPAASAEPAARGEVACVRWTSRSTSLASSR
jgi:hypothetical protein